jgi:RNA repair pathway DNA polymerase beta family
VARCRQNVRHGLDSDYDVRFVYVNRLDWYLTVEPGRDVIEQPISGELDVNGWDLRKALKLLRRFTWWPQGTAATISLTSCERHIGAM